MNQSYGACHFDEERGKYEMKSILAFVRIWAQNKTENRFGWLQALNRVVSRGERSSGSILFLAFPQELIVKLADRTGGKFVRVHVPKLYEGFVRTDSSGRVFLVDPLNGGQKHTFLFKLKDGNILLDDKPEQTQADASTKVHGEETTAAQAAVVDEDVEFPSVSTDGDVNDAPWIM
jgi:hypothetical protein